MKLIRLLTVVVVLVSITSIIKAQSVIDPNQQWGADNNGLRLGISPVVITYKDEPQIMFYIVFENTGKNDIILNLGIMLGNGKVLLPDKILLILTDEAGKKRELHFADKRYAGVGGRVDDYVVPLRAGSIYMLKLKLAQFWSPNTKEFEMKLKSGKYQVFAQFEGGGAEAKNTGMEGIGLMNFWKGKLQSNILPFEL